MFYGLHFSHAYLKCNEWVLHNGKSFFLQSETLFIFVFVSSP